MLFSTLYAVLHTVCCSPHYMLFSTLLLHCYTYDVTLTLALLQLHCYTYTLEITLLQGCIYSGLGKVEL